MSEEYEVIYPSYMVSGVPSNWQKSITFSLEHAIEVIKDLYKWQQKHGKIIRVTREEEDWRQYV